MNAHDQAFRREAARRTPDWDALFLHRDRYAEDDDFRRHVTSGSPSQMERAVRANWFNGASHECTRRRVVSIRR